MDPTSKTRIAVIGGGPVGRLTAAALHRSGFRVTLYSGSPTVRSSPRALFLWSSALRAVAAVDPTRRAWTQKLVERSQPIERMDIVAWSGAHLSALPIGALGRSCGWPTVVVEPDTLTQVLKDLVHGVDERPLAVTAVDAVEPDWSKFELQVAGGGSDVYDLVLIADGRQSKFRHKIQDAAPVVRPAFQDAFIGVYEPGSAGASPRLPVGTSLTVLGPRARIWLTPLRDEGQGKTGRIAWYASVKRERGVLGPRTWDVAGLRALFDCGPELAREVLRDEKHTVRLAIDDVAPTRPWVRGGLALLGDAAHSPTPDLGFGACLGIEGAMTLVHRLVHAKGCWSAALAAYEAQHFPRARRLVELSRAAALLSMPESRLADAGRNLVTRRLFGAFATDDLRHLLAYEACPA